MFHGPPVVSKLKLWSLYALHWSRWGLGLSTRTLQRKCTPSTRIVQADVLVVSEKFLSPTAQDIGLNIFNNTKKKNPSQPPSSSRTSTCVLCSLFPLRNTFEKKDVTLDYCILFAKSNLPHMVSCCRRVSA